MQQNIEIIPAIDLINGACVRLSQGDYGSTKVYNTNPVEVAKAFQERGYKRLHLVDLDGAKAGKPMNIDVLQRIATETSLIIDYSGGLRTVEDIRAAFAAGADSICLGSIAQRNPQTTLTWLDEFGKERIILGFDVRGNEVYTDGWKVRTGTTIDELLNLYSGKAKRIMCTDIATDGMLQGTNVALYEQLMRQWPDYCFIASGGVSGPRDIELLNEAGVPYVIVGKALYEGLLN
ncbi:MAG: 1-(5-phosphoribosyl)-5-[(5-phosphoribosylamino)methylideneamino]imidazole-4-carboxamide isomerase [Marinifilaceae bacterium]